MTKEQEMEIISKEILTLKQKKDKEFFLETRLPLYFKGGAVSLTVILTILGSVGSLGAFYSINRDKIIFRVIIGMLGLIIIFISFVATKKIIIKRRNSIIDKQIKELKIKYEEIKGSR